MRQLTLTQFITLDGVVQAPGGPGEDTSGGFTKGGWVPPFFDDELGKVMDARFARAGGFVLGRRTFDIFESHWPHVGADDPVAAKLNQLPKYVASTTRTSSEWSGTTFLDGDVAAAVGDLKRADGGELQIHGSGRLARALMAADLVDVYELAVFPVVLGQGKRLFQSGIDRALQLVDCRRTETGVAVMTYAPAGPLTFADLDASRSS